MIKERPVKMMMSALQNNKGLTLVEVLIAMVVFLLVSLALMQTALVSIDSNMTNIMRDEAVRIADMRLSEARDLPFIDLKSDVDSLGDCVCPANNVFPFTTGECERRNVRNVQDFAFCTNLWCVELGGDGNCVTDDADNKQVNVTIGWKWKGEDYTHNVSTIVKRR